MVDPHQKSSLLIFHPDKRVSTGPVKCLGLLTVLLRFCFFLRSYELFTCLKVLLNWRGGCIGKESKECFPSSPVCARAALNWRFGGGTPFTSKPCLKFTNLKSCLQVFKFNLERLCLSYNKRYFCG